MTGRVRKISAATERAPKIEVQRVRVDAQGYDTSGTYWGAGPDVFIARIARLRREPIARLRHDATSADGAPEIAVRAKSIAEAREKITAELARPLGQPKSGPREALGGASPNKTRYEVDWCDPVGTSSIRIRITHSRDYLSLGQDHVEVESLRPRKAALPCTDTGYRSHFMPPLDLVNAGGPVTFVTAWLDREAKGRDWQKRQAERSQGDLFQWADTNTEVGKRKSPAKPKRPIAKPAKPRTRRRDPA